MLRKFLSQIESGDPKATDRLLPLVYDELKRMAEAKMNREPSDHTLQPTALVNEAFLRLVGSEHQMTWENRRHFFGAAAEAMRRVLIDAARRRGRLKRGAGFRRDNDGLLNVPRTEPDEDVESLSEALDRFSEIEPQKAELVKLRFFAGMTISQAAELLGISTSTAERHWSYARAWLFRQITRNSG